MADALRLVGGDEIIEPFLLQGSDGEIFNLTGKTITGAVWWRERLRIPLAVGVDIIVRNVFPSLALEGFDQDPHGIITLTEAQTILFPLGQIASLRLLVVDADGVTMSTYHAPLERIV